MHAHVKQNSLCAVHCFFRDSTAQRIPCEVKLFPFFWRKAHGLVADQLLHHAPWHRQNNRIKMVCIKEKCGANEVVYEKLNYGPLRRRWQPLGSLPYHQKQVQNCRENTWETVPCKEYSSWPMITPRAKLGSIWCWKVSQNTGNANAWSQKLNSQCPFTCSIMSHLIIPTHVWDVWESHWFPAYMDVKFRRISFLDSSYAHNSVDYDRKCF